MDIQYGATLETTTLDDLGSIVTVEKNVVNSDVIHPIRSRYEVRVRVSDKKEELSEYIRFSESLSSDKLDACFKIERTQAGTKAGYYYIVKCFTILT